jgi:hypothetical protein
MEKSELRTRADGREFLEWAEVYSRALKGERGPRRGARMRRCETTVVAGGWTQHVLPFFGCDPRSRNCGAGTALREEVARQWRPQAWGTRHK